MEDPRYQATNPTTLQPQSAHPRTVNWLNIALFMGLELGVVAVSVYAGVQIGKNQIQPTRMPERPSPTLSSVIVSPTEALPSTFRGSATVTLPPMPTISQISVCNRQASSLFPTPKQDSLQMCQVLELRTRDLLRATYNIHQLLREIQNGQIEQPVLNRVNTLNNDLVELWLNIAGYGLGTDPYVNIHIFVSGTAFKDAQGAPSYGIPNDYSSIGMPRLYTMYVENSSLSQAQIQKKVAEFLQLTQPYANPAQYPHRDFFDRAYSSYREGKLLTTQQYQEDLKKLDAWFTSLEKVLEQIPAFLRG